jgi:hypothetical protein
MGKHSSGSAADWPVVALAALLLLAVASGAFFFATRS